jgi:phospholipase C
MVKVRVSRPLRISRFRSMLSLIAIAMTCSLFLLVTGCGSVGAGSNPATVTITASPTTVAAGGTSTLTVTATNATGVTVTGSDGSSKTMAAAGGTLTVTPTNTTTYTATAAGSGGNATATATVTVGTAPPPPTAPTVTIAANPTTITMGSNSTLTIAATNATAVVVTGSDGTTNTLAPAGGTVTVSPAATTTYTATATGAAGTTPVTATATVTVVPAGPPTVTLSANPTTIVAPGSTTLTVMATNATTLLLQGTDGSSFSSPTNFPATGGTEVVSPAQTATYTATATGPGGTATATVVVTVTPAPMLTITANPQSIVSGNSSTLTVTTTNVTNVVITGTDGSNYPVADTGGTQSVSPTTTTTYTVTANSPVGVKTASATVTVVPPGTVESINHVIFMLQENHTFDNYFGMLNPYRSSKGWDIGSDGKTYTVDGIDDKWNTSYLAGPGKGVKRTISNNDQQSPPQPHTLYPFKSTCVDDMSSAWTESYYDESFTFLTTRAITVSGFVSNADGFANSKCPGGVGPCTGFSDTTGDRAMGFYDQTFLNYYYYMASQFALSDRWFSPVSSKSIPNRIATFTGGSTQGITQDPGQDDKLPQLGITTIFHELDTANVSWKIYYLAVNGQCDPTSPTCQPSGVNAMPATTFSDLSDSFQYLNMSKPCTGKTQPSSVVGDTTNSFCIDPTHIAPLKDKTYGYFADLNNGTLPSFAFIESGSGFSDEHPGYQQTILDGQVQVASIINNLMTSTSWKDSVFFFGYDEGGGPYEHVPPVPNHTNDWTDNAAVLAGTYPTDISTIAVNADSYKPCSPPANPDGTPGPATLHCDLKPNAPGSIPTDDPSVNGFAAQLGFRIPNLVISPFAKKHYVSHTPMDHTAIIKFVENRFIDNDATGMGPTHLTPRDAAQPNLLDFFDFSNTGPWATPPTPPTPVAPPGNCNPVTFH